MITVATWNVLHRIHAENWYEDVSSRWPDEAARIDAVTERVAARTEQVIALQEVSGDQLISLRAALPGRTVHSMQYPRVPTARRHASALRDPSEHLVLIVEGASREIAGESFADDGGKGALAVSVEGVVVISTHVSGDRRRTKQLARLAEVACATPEYPAVLLGDFNTDRATVVSSLGERFSVAELSESSLATRPRTSGSKSQVIDHVVVRDATVREVVVEDSGGLSDHNLVRAAIAL
ncbi:endonuclease/exonuclease/phosphatase family metal-dependent hydrolase [Nocardia tenerifensis]|uniref:Endonuclease/exonuclease/phosphatase family metal-dependent hydrolase n=1 Tax=Nocardia tenerifensis TaxID=228006 RepID=A0A318KYU7_9NOCA|nr:endonuclease/exonuclease/phosphatase family protein [Nocardia tenerifensis]PXX71024.1 endonuclease/exonuclease/phosphatase family metal-dependent hydrolase [Nocardia tenerifensis]